MTSLVVLQNDLYLQNSYWHVIRLATLPKFKLKLYEILITQSIFENLKYYIFDGTY